MAPVPKPRPKHATFLKNWRKHKGLTQEKAADQLGIDRTTLSKIERGLVPYNQVLLELAAEAYGCDPADLIMRDPKSPVWTLLDTVRGLSEAQQKHVAGIIRGYLESTDRAA